MTTPTIPKVLGDCTVCGHGVVEGEPHVATSSIDYDHYGTAGATAPTYTHLVCPPVVELFNMVNLDAAGLRLRGKRVLDEWQVHAVGCPDGDTIKAYMLYVDHGLWQRSVGTLAELEAEFAKENGPPYDTGWEWGQHVSVKPCVGRAS